MAKSIEGDVLRELKKESNKFNADIMIYGGHHHASWNIFNYERVPDKDKINLNKPLVIASREKVA